MTFTDEVKEKVLDSGAELVGITSTEKINEYGGKGHTANDWLPNSKSAVVFAVKLLDASLDGLPFTRSAYDWNKMYLDEKISKISMEISRFFENKGFLALPITFEPQLFNPLKGDISVKHVAVEAGLGQIGLSNLLITPQYGPRVRLGLILTTAELIPDEPFREKLCPLDIKKCTKCIDICPPKALRIKNEKLKTRWDKCALYIYKDLTALPTTINDQNFVNRATSWHAFHCGLCISACPIGKVKNKKRELHDK
ncbi:MAG: 4Fe-4S double cluster binding domain-containing protein [Candidatus Helarchaeota archaeon]